MYTRYNLYQTGWTWTSRVVGPVDIVSAVLLTQAVDRSCHLNRQVYRQNCTPQDVHSVQYAVPAGRNCRAQPPTDPAKPTLFGRPGGRWLGDRLPSSFRRREQMEWLGAVRDGRRRGSRRVDRPRRGAPRIPIEIFGHVGLPVGFLAFYAPGRRDIERWY